MKLKRTHSIEQAALRSGFSRDTGYRIHRHPWLASQKNSAPHSAATGSTGRRV